MIKRLIAALTKSLGLRPPVSSLLTPEQFTLQFAEQLQASAPQLVVCIKNVLHLSLAHPDGAEANMYLDNAFHQYQVDPSSHDSIVAQYIASACEQFKFDQALDSSRLIAIIKDKAWIAEIQASLPADFAQQSFPLVYEELNQEFVVIYAEDGANNIRYFTQENLAQADLGLIQLRTLALSNLRRLLPQPEFTYGANVSMVTVGGTYEASLLLFDEIWQNMAREYGEVVVAVPARDLLLFTSINNAAGLQELQQLASKLANEAAYRLSDSLFVYRNQRFIKFE